MPKIKQHELPKEIILTKTLLKKRYGPHVERLFVDQAYMSRLPRKKGEITKYQVLKPLPTESEFRDIRAKYFETTVSSLVEDAALITEELINELQEWYDALPESFQNGDKGQEIEEAKDTLEGINWPEVDEASGKIKTVYIPAEKIESRGDRAADAAGMLSAALEALRDAANDLEAVTRQSIDPDEQEKEAGGAEEDPRIEELRDLAEELETTQQELEGVSFPGMY